MVELYHVEDEGVSKGLHIFEGFRVVELLYVEDKRISKASDSSGFRVVEYKLMSEYFRLRVSKY